MQLKQQILCFIVLFSQCRYVVILLCIVFVKSEEKHTHWTSWEWEHVLYSKNIAHFISKNVNYINNIDTETLYKMLSIIPSV